MIDASMIEHPLLLEYIQAETTSTIKQKKWESTHSPGVH